MENIAKVAILFLIVVANCSEQHLTVYPGDFYSSPFLKIGYHTNKVAEARIKLGETSGNYWIPHKGHESD